MLTQQTAFPSTLRCYSLPPAFRAKKELLTSQRRGTPNVAGINISITIATHEYHIWYQRPLTCIKSGHTPLTAFQPDRLISPKSRTDGGVTKRIISVERRVDVPLHLLYRIVSWVCSKGAISARSQCPPQQSQRSNYNAPRYEIFSPLSNQSRQVPHNASAVHHPP